MPLTREEILAGMSLEDVQPQKPSAAPDQPHVPDVSDQNHGAADTAQSEAGPAHQASDEKLPTGG